MNKAILCVLLALTFNLHAGLHIWSGAVNGNWSNAGNWSSGGAPFVGEANVVLHFPSGTPRELNTNNFVGLNVDTIRISGNAYRLHGNAVLLNVTAPGVTNLIMAGGGIGAFIHHPLVLLSGERNVSVDAFSTLYLSGAISGAGALTKHGPGTLRLDGDSGNSFTGGFSQFTGKVVLGKTSGVALPGPVTIGQSNATANLTMSYDWDHQIADAASVYVRGQDSWLLLEGHYDTLGALELIGGQVVTYQSGNASVHGELRLNGNVKADDSDSPIPTEPEISGWLNLGDAQRTFTIPSTKRLLIFATVSSTGTNGGITLAGGGGTLQFHYANTFDGPVRIQSGEIAAYHSDTFGSSVGSTILEDGQVFMGYGCFVATERLEVRQNASFKVAATNAWNGPIVVQTNAVLSFSGSSQFGGFDWLTLGGAISGPGKMFCDIDRVDFYGATPNTLSGGHTIRGDTFMVLGKSTSNALSGPITFQHSSGTYPTLFWAFDNQIHDASTLQWADAFLVSSVSGGLTLSSRSEVVGSLQGRMQVTINCGAGTLAVGVNNLDSDYAGILTGTGSGTNLVKIGSGTFLLGGNHSLTGKTLVNGGSLILKDTTGIGPVHVNNNASLAGGGSLGAITVSSSGAVTPGASLLASSYGVLRPTSFAPGGGILGMGVNGPIPGVDFDQIAVSGSVNLTGVLLQLSALNLPHGSNTFRLIDVTGTGAVTGTFTGLPEGEIFASSDGKAFRITYQGGTGNDVVITRHYTVAPGGTITGVARLPDGRIQINGTGLAFESYRVLANTNLSTTNWVHIGSVSSGDEFGLLEFIDAGAVNHPMRFYRFAIP